MATGWTRLARVPWIDEEDWNPSLKRFVRNERIKLGKPPVMQPCSLSALGRYPRANTREIFKGNCSLGAFRLLHELFGNAVVRVLLKSSLSTGNLAELPASCPRPLTLKVPSAMGVTAAAPFDVITGEGLPIRVDRKVYDTQVDTKNIAGLDRSSFSNITSRNDKKLATLHLEIDFALSISEELPLVLSANKRHLDATINRPDGNHIVGTHPKNTVVEWLGCDRSEPVLVLLVPLVTGSNFGDALNNNLRRKPGGRSDRSVGDLMNCETVEGFLLPSVVADIVAGGVSRPQRLQQRRPLFQGWQELYRGYQLHVTHVTMSCCEFQLFPTKEDAHSSPA